MTTSVSPRTVNDDRALPVVSALEDRGLLDPARREEAIEVVDRVLGGRAGTEATLRRRLVEVAGYVGGALVVAAGALFFADQWLNLSTAQQVGLPAGIAVLFWVAGVTAGVTGGGPGVLRSGTQPVRQRLASVLFTAGAVAAAAAVIVALVDVVQQRGTEAEEGAFIGLGGSLTLVVLGLVGYLLAPTLLGQLAVAVGAGYAIPFALDVLGVADPVPLGLAFAGVGALWVVLAERAFWREVLAGQVIGSLFLLVGAQIPVASDTPWVGYLGTLLVALAGFTLYLTRRAWPYLAVGVAGVTLAVPEALLDWTEGSLGTAGVLLVAGVTLLGASLVGLRLRKEVGEDQR